MGFAPPELRRAGSPDMSPRSAQLGPSADAVTVTPAWASDILDRLNSLAAKHDGLRAEVAELRSQLGGSSEQANVSAREQMDAAIGSGHGVGKSQTDGLSRAGSHDGNDCRAAAPFSGTEVDRFAPRTAT